MMGVQPAICMIQAGGLQQGQSAEQREEYQKLLWTLSNFRPDEVENSGTDDNKSREPNLNGLTPVFDLEMFREAQARAAEEMLNLKKKLKQLPTRVTVQEQSKAVNSAAGGAAGTKKLGIKTIELGRFEMDVWYNSPYPEEYQCLSKLYLCEFCLKYMNSSTILRRHLAKCIWRHPPGDEIYRKHNYSFFEVDGEKNKVYCQNLCLLAKLFLDHKTLYFDVEPFLFYVLTEADAEGCHMIGYFSKEKNSFLNYNVSCILIIPHYQRKGFGRMLIDFSYLLSREEHKVGSPEKPLSDLGLISYRSYWKNILLEFLAKHKGNEIVIKDLSQETGILAYDIVSTLQSMQLLKYWKGKHLIIKKKEAIEDYLAKSKKTNPDLIIDPSKLRWVPYQSR
ncbi:KAT7 [Cordylochernes scorpioides]|uniref:Histone acetyltransferase n=1 Tax=Cordylochernes scorpioides TaxID=51811 RepID=A0ABY6LPE9_9ARAC|nr:KAT7 [Cordylochernes scorpioides]